MRKILVIGKCPPSHPLGLPNDTTRFYDILGWVQISREAAQELFYFSYVYNLYTGESINPSIRQMLGFWPQLKKIIDKYDKIIVVGAHASRFLLGRIPPYKEVVHIVYPQPSSGRSRLKQKTEIIVDLTVLIFGNNG